MKDILSFFLKLRKTTVWEDSCGEMSLRIYGKPARFH